MLQIGAKSAQMKTGHAAANLWSLKVIAWLGLFISFTLVTQRQILIWRHDLALWKYSLAIDPTDWRVNAMVAEHYFNSGMCQPVGSVVTVYVI